MTDPTVSVVMAVHNEAEYLSDAVESILNQSYSNFEFIIVDDGSTDGSVDIVESISDDRIRLQVNESNRGLPTSLNRGIRASRGKYVARMDADDRSEMSRLEKQVGVLDEEPSVHVVGCWIRLINAEGDVLGTKKYEELPCDPDTIREKGPNIAHPSVMIRKRALQQVDGYREEFTYAQDLDMWVRMAREFSTDFIRILPEYLFDRRITPGNYRKQPVQRAYANLAGVSESELAAVERIESVTSPLSERRQLFRYYYRVGRLQLVNGSRVGALTNFVTALTYKPTDPRPWYWICLMPLPNKAGRWITDRIQTLLEQPNPE